MSHKKLLEGILDKHSNVVVKIADIAEDIKIEYETYVKLSATKVSGIVQYHCYFECNDDIHRFLADAPHICKGTGSTMRVLVMEYIKNKSFQEHPWKVADKETIKSCIKQVLCTVLDAFLKTGFVHGDLHCNNILIKPTTAKMLDYDFIAIPLWRYKTKLMDFEYSKFDQDVKTFFKHIHLVFATSLTRYFAGMDGLNSNVFSAIYNDTKDMWENSSDPMDILKLIPKIDKL